MPANNTITDLNVLLKAVRLQIELLQASIKAGPHDKELRKRLKKAKGQESVILKKLAEWTLN